MVFRRTLWRISSIKIIQKLKFKRFISCILVCILQVIMVDTVQIRSRESSFSSWGFAKLLARVFHLCMNLCVCRPDDPIVIFDVRQMADSRDSSFQHVGTGTWSRGFGSWRILKLEQRQMLWQKVSFEYDYLFCLLHESNSCVAQYIVGCQEQLLFVVLFTGTAELSSQGPRWSTHCAVVVKGLGGQGQAKKDARFLHRNGSMSSGVHEEIGVLFGKADILALGASTSYWICPQKMRMWSSTGNKSNPW